MENLRATTVKRQEHLEDKGIRKASYKMNNISFHTNYHIIQILTSYFMSSLFSNIQIKALLTAL